MGSAKEDHFRLNIPVQPLSSPGSPVGGRLVDQQISLSVIALACYLEIVTGWKFSKAKSSNPFKKFSGSKANGRFRA